jgi:hypothetical protein
MIRLIHECAVGYASVSAIINKQTTELMLMNINMEPNFSKINTLKDTETRETAVN